MSESFEDCLHAFIKHVQDLLHEDGTGSDGYWREFMKLREVQKVNKEGNDFVAEAGKKSVNIKKNRFKDIIPFDATRVCLSTLDGIEESDYINASFIKDIDGNRGYIAAQGPLPNTVNDFWRMLWEYDTEIVFMACLVQEGGKRKCEQYWPDLGESKEYGKVKVTMESEKEISQDLIKRELKAESESRVHHLIQFQYLGWADHGIPRTPSEIRKMVGKMREERIKETVPLVIHCSAGCGRTGTICAVDYAWNLLLYRRISDGFDLFDIIKVIREQRQSMVQTPDQYELVHLVLKDLCEEMLHSSSDAEYVNIGFEDEYVNLGAFAEQEPVDELYQEVEVSKTEMTQLKVVEVPVKPVIKTKPKPTAVPQQKETKESTKTEIASSEKKVSTPSAYENVVPKNIPQVFKTIIKVGAKFDTQQTKKPSSQSSDITMTTKTNQSQTSSMVSHAKETKPSQSVARIAENFYAKVEQNQGLQPPHTDGAKALRTDGATASRTDGATASRTDGATASRTDGATASRTDSATASHIDSTTAPVAAQTMEYSPVDFNKKDLPVCVASQKEYTQRTLLYENHFLPSSYYENYNLPSVTHSIPVGAGAPVKKLEDDAPAIPDRKYDLQELGTLPSEASVKNLAPPKPVISSAPNAAPSSSGQPVVNTSKAQVTSGVQVKALGPKVLANSGGKDVSHGVKIPVKSGVQVLKPSGPQTKGTEGVKIHSAGGMHHTKTSDKDEGQSRAAGGSYGRKMGERHPHPNSAQSRTVTTPVQVFRHPGGSVRGMSSAEQKHGVHKMRAYDNVVINGSGHSVPHKLGFVKTLMGGAKGISTAGTPLVGYTGTEIGYPHRVGRPNGEQVPPWVKPNPR